MLISNVLNKKQTRQLFDWNKYGKTTWSLLTSCPLQVIWPDELETERCYYHPCFLGETEGVCAIAFLPWRVWHCFTQSSVSWGQGHGWTPPMGSRLLQVLWPKPALPAFPRCPFKNIANWCGWKGQECGIIPAGPFPRKGIHQGNIDFTVKREEPLNLIWCHICHHVLFH